MALCKLLLEAPDMLLLDEPTNHLDAETIAWLQQHLIDYKGTILIVTHDRYFLDDITSWILELDRGRGIPTRATIPPGWNKRPSACAGSPRGQIQAERRWNANWNGCAGAKGPASQSKGPDQRL